MGWLVSLLFGFLKPGVPAATRAAGTFNGLAAWSAVVGGIVWLFGPGRVWSITLNGLEIVAVFAVGAIIGHILLNMSPPRSGSFP